MQQQPTISFYVPAVTHSRNTLSSLKEEACIFIALDASFAVTESITVTSHHSSQVDINIRSVLLSILDPFTTSVIVIHNHPSQRVYPSKADYYTTYTLVTVGELLHFTILDHIIVTKKDYFSFAEEGVLDDIKNRFA